MPELESKQVAPDRNSLCVVAAEALFILLPFVVTAIVFSGKGQFSKFLYMPEWAFAASILIGLALTRFTAGLLQGNAMPYSWERVMLIVTLVIVFAFVPSLMTLSLVLVSEVPSNSLAIAQVALSVLGLFLFVALGWTGQQFVQDARDARRDPRNAELQVISGSRAVGE